MFPHRLRRWNDIFRYDVETMLVQCWPSAVDADKALIGLGEHGKCLGKTYGCQTCGRPLESLPPGAA